MGLDQSGGSSPAIPASANPQQCMARVAASNLEIVAWPEMAPFFATRGKPSNLLEPPILNTPGETNLAVINMAEAEKFRQSKAQFRFAVYEARSPSRSTSPIVCARWDMGRLPLAQKQEGSIWRVNKPEPFQPPNSQQPGLHHPIRGPARCRADFPGVGLASDRQPAWDFRKPR